MTPPALGDQVVIVVALGGLAAVSWLYMYRLAGQMDDMAMPAAFSPWTAADFPAYMRPPAIACSAVTPAG